MKKNTILSSAILVSFLISIMVVSPVSAATVGLVAEWDFDEGTGSVVTDSANGNDGTLSGGKFGNALYFDGTNDYVDIGDIGVTGDWTIEFWVNIATSDPTIQYPIGTGPAGNTYNSGVFVMYTADRWGIYDGYDIVWGNVLSVNEWYHIAVTKSGTSYTLFLDGTQEATGTLDDIDITDLQFGRRMDPSGPVWYFKGLIDEVRVSDIVRYSSNFIKPSSPFELPEGNTVGLWHFDESDDDGILYDETDNDNDGIIVGATWAGPNWTEGKFGNALLFDGLGINGDDFVNVPDSDTLDVTGSITLEAWIYINSFETHESPNNHIYILGKDTLANQRSYGIGILAGDHNPFMIVFQYGTVYEYAAGTTTLNTGTWYHLAGTFDSSTGDVKIFVNGVEDGALPSSLSSIFSGSADLQFGARQYPGARCFFNGIIDEVRIWNIALPLAEIDIDPDTLNLKSNGKWITAYIELPSGYDVTDIDVGSIQLSCDTYTDGVDPDAPTAIGDYDGDGVPDLMVKFNRLYLVEHLDSVDFDGQDGKFASLPIIITGGIIGKDTIRVRI